MDHDVVDDAARGGNGREGERAVRLGGGQSHDVVDNAVRDGMGGRGGSAPKRRPVVIMARTMPP